MCFAYVGTFRKIMFCVVWFWFVLTLLELLITLFVYSRFNVNKSVGLPLIT